MATFQRFEQCFGPLVQSLNISLSKVYKEICGEKKKYITFRRLISSFLKYKNTPRNTSIDFKKFFSFVFNTLIKNEKDYIGTKLKKSSKYSTANCKKKKAISKLTVLSNSKAEIRGFQIVYDDFFKNELYSKHETRLYVSLELGLNMLTQSTQSKQQHKMFASHRRDAISHVFGTFDNTLTFIGFKCRSGKTVHVGKPKGDAFLFGVPGSVFHYMKVEVLDGVTCLQPFFTVTKRSNPLMKIGLDKITEQYLVNEDHPIYEETVMHKINDPDKLDKVIMHQFVDDTFYYDDKNNDKIKGNSFFDLFQLEKRYWQAEMASKKNTPISYDNLVKEAAEYAKRKHNNNVNGDGNDDDNTNTNTEVIIPKKGDKRPWRPVHPNSNYYNEDEQHEEDVDINEDDNNTTATTTWDGVSIKNTNPRMFLFNYDNYLKLCERLESSIAYEINKHNKATSNASSSSNADTNFYDKYLMNYLGFEHKKNILTGIYGEHVLDSQSPTINEHDYDNQLTKIKNRFLNNHHIKNISNDYFLDASPSSFTEPSETKAEKTKLAQLNWFKHCNRLSRSSGLFILRTIAAVIRTVQSLHKMEDNFIDKSLPLQDKIKIYEILTANKHIIKFLTKAHATPKASVNAHEQTATNDVDDDDDDECNNNIDTSAYETNDNAQLKTNDLNDINNKIAYIEKLIKTKPNLFTNTNISEYYEYLKRKRNKIINALNEEQTDIYINELNYNPEQALRDEEAERQRQIEAEEAAIALEEEEERNAVHDKVNVISIKNMEIPPNTEIYKYQTMCKPGVTWTDEYFKPETSNLCPVDNNGNWSLPEDIYPEDINGWEDIHWQRVETIFNSADFQVFFEGVNNDDIIQGGLGDCYFLSAIAALCKFPTLIKKLFYFKEKSQEHCYGVYLRINGKWELVLVDDYIPCYGDNVHYAMNFAFSSTNGNELWVILLEKAWAKINGNYAKIIGGEPHEVFDVITDAYSEKLNVASAVANELWEKMIEGEKNGFIMTAGTSGDTYNLDIEDVGLVPGHAYTVLGVREVNVNGVKDKVVHVRNPWGNGEWSGEWSDSSDIWNAQLRKELGMDGEVDDGEFYMSFKDFIKYFVVLGVCRLYADYTSTLLRYEPEQVQTGCKITCVDVTVDNTNVYLMLHQKNPRIVLKNGTYQKPVIAYLCLMDSDYNYITASTNTEMNLCIYTTLNKGKYYLISDIAYRFVQPEQMHGYNLTTYASNPVGLTALTNVNAIDALRKCLFSYAKAHITPLVDLGGNIYRSKRYCKEFPFAFAVFENRSNNAITITDVLSYRGVKSVCFYEEGNNEHARSLQKTIKAKGYDVFIHMPYTMSSMFEYALTSDVKADEGEMEDIVFNETGQSIDDKGYIKEYVHEIGGGYLIGIENKGTCKEYLKIVMEGLYEVNNPNESEVTFTLMGKSRKVFNLKLKENYKGDISYMFDYA